MWPEQITDAAPTVATQPCGLDASAHMAAASSYARANQAGKPHGYCLSTAISAYLSALTPPDVAGPPSGKTADDYRTDYEIGLDDGYSRALTHLAAENALLREREGWLPIETAPKEGLIDIWINDGDGAGVRWCDCYYDRICNEWRTSRPSGRLLMIVARHVTHWRSPPASPSHQEQNNG